MAVNGVFLNFILLSSFLWRGAHAYCNYCVYNYWYFWCIVFSLVFLCVILLRWCCSYHNRKRQQIATTSVNTRHCQQARPSIAGAGPAYPSGQVQPPQQMPVKPPDYYNGPPPGYPVSSTNNAWDGSPPAYPAESYPAPSQHRQTNPAYVQPMPSPDYPQQQQFPAVRTDPAYPPSPARY